MKKSSLITLILSIVLIIAGLLGYLSYIQGLLLQNKQQSKQHEETILLLQEKLDRLSKRIESNEGQISSFNDNLIKNSDESKRIADSLSAVDKRLDDSAIAIQGQLDLLGKDVERRQQEILVALKDHAKRWKQDYVQTLALLKDQVAMLKKNLDQIKGDSKKQIEALNEAIQQVSKKIDSIETNSSQFSDKRQIIHSEILHSLK